MKRFTILLFLLLLSVGSAFADLTGANATINYIYPDEGTVLQTLATGNVPLTGNSFGQHDVTVNPDSITLTNVEGGNVFFLTSSFNGYQVVVNSGGDPITGVTIAVNNVTGFDASRVTFDATDVWFNMQDLTTNPGLDIQLDLQFGAGAVPEPGSLVLLGSGLVGVAGMIRKKLHR